VNFHKLRTGCPTEAELQKLLAIFPKVVNAPIILDDAGGLTMHEVRSRLRAMKHRHGIRLAIVDYLQLISLTKEQMFLGAASGYADVARGLQQAAKELQIPIIIISQLSNEGRKRKKHERPKLTDFRETGAIGDVANFAGILWRRELEPEEEEKLRDAIKADPMGNHVLELQMDIIKNKNGPSGTAMGLEFMRWCMRFEDLQYKSKEDEPELIEPKGPTLIDRADVPNANANAND
jgi:replicative DNA helicase